MSDKPFRVGCMDAGQIFNEAHLPSRLNPDQVGLLGAACLAWNISPISGVMA